MGVALDEFEAVGKPKGPRCWFQRLTPEQQEKVTAAREAGYAYPAICSGRLAKPTVQTWFNGIATALWLVMMPVTLMCAFFRTSILWLAFISAWALFATHLGAWIAALVNVKAERITNRTEENNHFARIEEAEVRILAAIESLSSDTGGPA